MADAQNSAMNTPKKKPTLSFHTTHIGCLNLANKIFETRNCKIPRNFLYKGVVKITLANSSFDSTDAILIRRLRTEGYLSSMKILPMKSRNLFE